NEIVTEQNLTTLMITHNMRDALKLGNRLIMMYDGRILFDVAGEEKQRLKIKDLLEMFEQAAGSELSSDSLLLS
ncbi:MAG: ABC transporter ATP-binding protein, partial [Selenomonadaceae bacterium]|nr:ABC transporter ATP-binding protein [Selenomonadaceae bacterium]